LSTHTVLEADGTQEKNARPAYLALMGLGAHFYLLDDPSAGASYRLVINTAGIVDKERRRVANTIAHDHRECLLALVTSGEADARAVVAEGDIQ
jgi:hypothetical protein